MSVVKLIFKIISALILLILIFIAGLIIYIQVTKPAVPDFETFKTAYQFENKHINPSFQWSTLETISPKILNIFFFSYERENFYARRMIANQLKTDYQLPIELFNPPQSYIQYIHGHLFLNDLESHWGRNNTLEAFLNLAFYGQHTYGIHDASHFYFDKTLHQLQPSEAIILISLFQAPTTLAVDPEKLFQSSCRTLTHLPIPEEEKDCDTLKPYLDTFFEYPVRAAQAQENAS